MIVFGSLRRLRGKGLDSGSDFGTTGTDSQQSFRLRYPWRRRDVLGAADLFFLHDGRGF